MLVCFLSSTLSINILFSSVLEFLRINLEYLRLEKEVKSVKILVYNYRYVYIPLRQSNKRDLSGYIRAAGYACRHF